MYEFETFSKFTLKFRSAVKFSPVRQELIPVFYYLQSHHNSFRANISLKILLEGSKIV